MSGGEEVSYTLEFGGSSQARRRSRFPSADVATAIPRVARLMALAIRFDELLRTGIFRDCAELARLGRVTRARMTQIMKLLHLAPDIQEQILFLPSAKGLNERNLRPLVTRIDWGEQRRLFEVFLLTSDDLPDGKVKSLSAKELT